MAAYDLPTSLLVGEVAYPINYGWKNAIAALAELSDPEKGRAEKVTNMVCRIFPQWAHIPAADIPEAIEKARWFLDCGREPDGKIRPKLMDWEQDADIIIPALNQVSGQEIRMSPDIHWWTVYGWFMSIDKGLFCTVLRIRNKLSTGEKLDKSEKKFYRENRKLVELKNKDTDAVRQAREEIKGLLGGG